MEELNSKLMHRAKMIASITKILLLLTLIPYIGWAFFLVLMMKDPGVPTFLVSLIYPAFTVCIIKLNRFLINKSTVWSIRILMSLNLVMIIAVVAGASSGFLSAGLDIVWKII